ncbi:hypothetical protein [Cellulomonas sp. Marseille-Q8402]
MTRRPLPATALLLLLAGCAAGTVHPGAAEVVADGPDCLATEVLRGLSVEPPHGHDRDAPRAGSVPVGFDPVAVVECRGPLSEIGLGAPMTVPGPVEPGQEATLLPAPPPPADLAGRPEHVDLSDVTGPQPGGPGSPATPDAPRAVTVTEVELRGDLDPLLADLARASRTPGPDQACPAMMEFQPQVYLVDAVGRAVRVQWPADECGFLLDGVTDGLQDLAEAGRATRTLPAA